MRARALADKAVLEIGEGGIEALLVIAACRRVKHGGQRRVVVAVTRPYCVGLAGCPELFGRVLAHRLQQPITRVRPPLLSATHSDLSTRRLS